MNGTTTGQWKTERQGSIPVIEAFIAAFILLFFIAIMTQAPMTAPEQDSALTERAHHVLTALDTAGQLRGSALAVDLDRITDRVQTYLPGQQVATALLALNSTTAEHTFNTAHTRNFTVSGATERQVLRLWYRDAAAPNVSISGTYIVNNTGTVTGEQAVIDITPYTVIGTNTLRIDVAGSSRIGYSIDIYDRERSGTPPSTANVFTSSYTVSGVNSSFHPTEVTVLTWQ